MMLGAIYDDTRVVSVVCYKLDKVSVRYSRRVPTCNIKSTGHGRAFCGRGRE